MRKPLMPVLREILRNSEDGYTIKELSCIVDYKPDTVNCSLKAMPDVYIDRWILLSHSKGKYSAVWMAVQVPEHCPKPE